MELKRDEIIKALECCINDECDKCGVPFGNCQANLMQDALALIKELSQANEQLSESYDHLEKTKDELFSERARLVLENERLMREKTALECVVSTARNQAKADTVRQMQERLTTFFASDDTLKYSEVDAEYINSQIIKISKEMEEI